jgi:CRISPR system Cascade subunit CasE
MSYLTRAFIAFGDAGEYRLPRGRRLHDPYDWHQLAWLAFPGKPKGYRFLTRLDPQERQRRFRLLIVSPDTPAVPPDWPEAAESWQTRLIAPAFFHHAHYRFQLRVNPTKRDKATGRRLPLETDADLHAWLLRKGRQHGFAPAMETVRTMREGGWRWHTAPTARLHAVNFDGLLSVTDAAAFEQACLGGIGSAKAFGFGLLALVPADSLLLADTPPSASASESAAPPETAA